MRQFPALIGITTRDFQDAFNAAAQAWEEHIPEFTNIQQRVANIRKVRKVPSASNDVTATDRDGDFNWDASYLYYLFNNSGTLVWRRIASASW